MSDISEDNAIVVTPTHIVPQNSTTPVIYEPEDQRQYGHVIRISKMCAICRNAHIHNIHLARARDHRSYRDIASSFGVPIESVRKHFENHYALSEYSLKAIALKENTTPEANELVAKIFDGKTDFLEGATAVLKSKVSALNSINARINELNDKQEIDSAEDIDKQEFVMLHKLRQDDEDAIIKIYHLMDKKIFPFKKEELSNAVLAYKFEVLQKVLDEVALVLSIFRNKDEYRQLIREIAEELRNRFNVLEADILKSGGIMNTAVKEEPTNE